MNCKPVFILFNVNKDANSFDEILGRQLSYVKSYRDFVGVHFSKPLILVSGAKIDPNKSSSLVELVGIDYRPINLILFSLKALRYLRRVKLQDEHFYFVAGTPLQPLVIGRFLKSKLRNSKLQVSIHNDLRSWQGGGIKNLVKRVNFRFSIHKIDLFRFVSANQREVAKDLYPIPEKKTVVCPIPLEFPSTPTSYSYRSQPSLGFVGRVHSDRGVREWIEIANMLKGFSYLVAGDGPLLELFRRELKDATFKGRVLHKEIPEVYANISVLLSSAPLESYGLAIREALLFGVPVVTRKTSGTRELREKFPEIIAGYDTTDEAARAIAKFSGAIDARFFEEYRVWLQANQDKNLRELVAHWV